MGRRLAFVMVLGALNHGLLGVYCLWVDGMCICKSKQSLGSLFGALSALLLLVKGYSCPLLRGLIILLLPLMIFNDLLYIICILLLPCSNGRLLQ